MKIRGMGLIAAIVAMTVSNWTTPAHAENGKLNLHIDLGFGSGLVGPLAPPGNNDKLAHVAPYGWVSMDYVLTNALAIEGIGGVGYLIDLESAAPDVDENLIYNIGVGVRLRFLNDDSGYKKDGGKLGSNLWVSSHLGFFKYDGSQFGIDAAIGYELSVVHPVQVGFFVRGHMMFAGDNNNQDAAIFGGISLGFDLYGQSKDTDGDGLSDEREAKLGTSPMDADTDSDGLPDGLEVKTRTDPLNADTDYDGVPDGVEDADQDGRVDSGETDPRQGAATLVEDTDSDTVPDKQDACPDTPKGSNVNSKGCVVFEGKSFSFTGIRFRTGSATILKSSEDELLKAVTVMRDNPQVRVEIAGHTDSRGGKAKNTRLSQRRANAVKAYLVKRGVAADRMTTKGYGPSQPIKSNKTKTGRSANRRIEFNRLD